MYVGVPFFVGVGVFVTIILLAGVGVGVFVGALVLVMVGDFVKVTVGAEVDVGEIHGSCELLFVASRVLEENRTIVLLPSGNFPIL